LRRVEARAGIEPAHRGFADPGLTTWLPRPMGDGKVPCMPGPFKSYFEARLSPQPKGSNSGNANLRSSPLIHGSAPPLRAICRKRAQNFPSAIRALAAPIGARPTLPQRDRTLGASLWPITLHPFAPRRLGEARMCPTTTRAPSHSRSSEIATKRHEIARKEENTFFVSSCASLWQFSARQSPPSANSASLRCYPRLESRSAQGRRSIPAGKRCTHVYNRRDSPFAGAGCRHPPNCRQPQPRRHRGAGCSRSGS
jgi:hypothetical protein